MATKKKDLDPFDVEVGQRVRDARELAEVSQVELGRLLYPSQPSQVYRNEAGVRGFTPQNLVKVAELLRVSIDWLLTDRVSEFGAPKKRGALSESAWRPPPAPPAPTTPMTVTTTGELKPILPAYPKVLVEFYSSGAAGKISVEDDAFCREYIAKHGNHGKGFLDLERALKSDRYARSGSAEDFAALQEVAERQQKNAGVKRPPRPSVGPRRRKHDKSSA